ncbi:MAG: PepSY domain-containing protein [Zoogloeaceae bacterium]|jgi:hypothetical protein|nr:PepSY domain-containing protein [Zoogloeaceae bacterium]
MKLPLPFLCLCVLCFLTPALPAWAESEHDKAREAVRAGEIMPLEEVLRHVEKTAPGRVLKVELDQKGRRWVYKIKLLRNNGKLSKLYFDARDGTLLERGLRHNRQRNHHGFKGRKDHEDD